MHTASGGRASGGTMSSGGTTSSGGAATGGAAEDAGSNGGTDAGTAGNQGAGGQQMPPPKLGACDGLPTEGVFEEITPPQVKAEIGTKQADGQTRGGTFAIAVDPVNQGTVYAGTLLSKVWKSTDCGATWNVVATGTNAMD